MVIYLPKKLMLPRNWEKRLGLPSASHSVVVSFAAIFWEALCDILIIFKIAGNWVHADFNKHHKVASSTLTRLQYHL